VRRVRAAGRRWSWAGLLAGIALLLHGFGPSLHHALAERAGPPGLADRHAGTHLHAHGHQAHHDHRAPQDRPRDAPAPDRPHCPACQLATTAVLAPPGPPTLKVARRVERIAAAPSAPAAASRPAVRIAQPRAPPQRS
jgi:hypothetical protein